jgi:hypothetical protein
MKPKHWAIVHLVNVIARKDQDLIGSLLAHVVQILKDRVGRAAIPLLAPTGLVWLEQSDPAAGSVEIPRFAHADMFI